MASEVHNLKFEYHGLLENRKTTTPWNRKEQLVKYGAILQNERYVTDGKIITSAGVSAGIDMSLYLLSLVVNESFAKFVQLGMEYDPKPFLIQVPLRKPQKRWLTKFANQL